MAQTLVALTKFNRKHQQPLIVNGEKMNINAKIKDVLADDFNEEIEQASGKVLVDFYAPWCGPCKMMAPVVKQVAQEHDDITVIKVNADNNQALMAKLGIRGIPSLLLINHGKIVATQVGAASVKQIKEFVKQA